jgi:phosphopantothenoylcysteine decarboxylase/phosphopantothenate--cysteine ligase
LKKLSIDKLTLKNIKNNKNELKGKKITFCTTSSISVMKAPQVIRELIRLGAKINVFMTPNSIKIIHPNLMEWASGNPVISELTGNAEHVKLGDRDNCDLLMIAPATSNTISKIASGINDNAVTTVTSVALGNRIPTIIVPAMHESMYKHPILQENIKKLKNIGVNFIDPHLKDGKAKMVELKSIVEYIIESLMNHNDMKGINFLVTAGPTIEYIDPVRIITNKSSGKMGLEIAEEAFSRGANVTLILGFCDITPSNGIKTIKAETTEKMHQEIIKELKEFKYDIVIATAAPADYNPVKSYNKKIRTETTSSFTIYMKKTSKIINSVKKLNPKAFLIVFKAEHSITNQQLIKRSLKVLYKSKADLVIANDVAKTGSGFRFETNEVMIVDKEKNVIHIPLTSKKNIAKKIIDIFKKSKSIT